MARKISEFEEKALTTLELSMQKQEKIRKAWMEEDGKKEVIDLEKLWKNFLLWICPLMISILMVNATIQKIYHVTPDFIKLFTGMTFILVFIFFALMPVLLILANKLIVSHKKKALSQVSMMTIWKMYTKKRILSFVTEGLVLAASLLLIGRWETAFFVAGSIVIMYIIPLQARGTIKKALEKA